MTTTPAPDRAPTVPADLRRRLESDLRHRLRPMSGRNPHERGRSSTPVELLYDLTYVIAFGAAAEQLARQLGEGSTGPAIGAYLFAVFAISWAWMNFTWFASAYGNDDALFRTATIVQMIGVVVLTFGLPLSFSSAQHGGSPNNAVMVIGYVIMRVPLVGLWLRAARADPGRRRTALAYAATIAVAQAGWVLSAVLPLPVPVTVAVLVALALAEMTAPVVLERALGRAPWNAGHIAERFSLLTLITLGEVVAATTGAVAALVESHGWSAAAAAIAASGLVLAAALWWAYFLIPSRTMLEQHPGRTFLWRYAHLPMFGAVAAIGAGLRVAAAAVEEETYDLTLIAVALAVPVAAVVLMIFVTWSILMRSYDLSHVPLLLCAVLPLVAAVVVGSTAGSVPSSEPTLLVVVIGLVALSAVVEVVGHEIVGYRHTVRAVEDQAARS
ncbi:low temperature requirement protein A [Nakamurella endophytica]|uniref:Membrane protein n=1 Tax=Nakamurella endophytica TaxID=1748367 RepID=A0A917WDR5_9ACTN|nr:low temperature requirement protein A [Nakamurella endophytica]GGL97755.1 membrane protein [Nakamurella endophytica]